MKLARFVCLGALAGMLVFGDPSQAGLFHGSHGSYGSHGSSGGSYDAVDSSGSSGGYASTGGSSGGSSGGRRARRASRSAGSLGSTGSTGSYGSAESLGSAGSYGSSEASTGGVDVNIFCVAFFTLIVLPSTWASACAVLDIPINITSLWNHTSNWLTAGIFWRPLMRFVSM